MGTNIERVLVVGLGKVGSLVGTILHENGFSVRGLDAVDRSGMPFETGRGDVTDESVLAHPLGDADAVVSCLPYHLNLTIAKAAHARGVHYFDLTEDVPTTQAIRAMSVSGDSVMAPQCGLAPGFIGIVGASLTSAFDSLRSIELRVGALPQHPRGLLGYAFNWSAEGVVNEYLNECEVIRNGKHMWVLPMAQLETIVIHGIQLEAFTTSGGLGTMCETFDGRVDELNYKTMRYPGHCTLMKFVFNELHMRERRDEAGRILVNAKPPVNDDVVYVHAAVEGHKQGRLYRDEFVRAYYPIEIGGTMWRAISWTTAASVSAVVELVAGGRLSGSGFVKQEEIMLDDFLSTESGSLYKRTSHL